MKSNPSFFRDPVHLAEGLLNSEYVTILDGDKGDSAAYTMSYHREIFYEWCAGVWRVVADDEVKCRITRHLRKLKEQASGDADDVRITTAAVGNVILCLKEQSHISSDREFNTWPYDTESLGIRNLAMKNGVLMFYPARRDPHPVLKKHSPHFFNTVQLPYEYDPDGTCPMWEAFINTAMCGDAEYITLLQQWCGYLLTPDMRHHKFLLNVGDGSNGKSVFVDVLQGFIGAGNHSSVPVSRFGSPFALYGTFGKLLNATDETSHIVEEEAEAALKRYVTGMSMCFERKFKSPIEATPTAKLVINTNSLPRFRDRSNGTWRRILIVPWNYTVPVDQQIKDLAQEICSKELPGILNWAIRGLASLNHNNGFVRPGRTDELMEEYRRDSDPVRAFLLENYTYASNALGMPCSGLYGEYRAFCQENGYRSVNSRTFGQQVKRVFPQVNRCRHGSRADRQWVYDGLIASVSHVSYAASI